MTVINRTVLAGSLKSLGKASAFLTVLSLSSTGWSALDLIRDTWVERDGIPSGTVTALHEDDAGFLWVGTSSRLARFDGSHFIEATHLCPDLLGSSFFRSATSKKGRTWWGFMGGLVLFEQGRCQVFDADDGIRHPFIHALRATSDGGIWYGTGGTGVYRFHDRSTLHPAYAAHPELPGKVQALLVGPNETLWVGTDKGLLRLAGEEADVFTEDSGLPSSSVRTLDFGVDATLLVGTESGLVKLEGLGPSGRFVSVIPNAAITALLLDNDQQLWVGTESGLLGATADDGIWLTETRTRVGSLFEDSEGSVWVGTADGLERYRKGDFTSWGDRANFLALEERRQGGLWALDSLGAVHIVTDDSDRVVLAPLHIAGEGMLDVVEDVEGRLWIGGEELFQIDDRGGFQSFPVPRGEVSVLGPEKDGARLIATTDGRGDSRLYWFRDGVFSPFVPDLALQHIQRLVLSSDGNVWMSSGGQGISVVSPGGDVVQLTEVDGLPSNFVRGLLEDSEGRMWAATAKGLAAIENFRVHSLADEPLLPNASPVHLLLDREGFVWMNADDGIYRVALADLQKRLSRDADLHVRRFTRRDGLSSLEISWRPSGMMMHSSGRVFLAHPRGISSIETSQDTPTHAKVQLFLEEAASENRVLPKHTTPRLASGSGLTATLSVPELDSPELLRFRYRLAGVDSDWIEAHDLRTISYASLPPGRHTLLVSARRLPEPYEPPQRLLDVIVLPHWHETAGAKFVAIVCLLSAFLLFHKLRLRHSRRREKQLADHVARKTQQLSLEVRERKRAETGLLRLNAELDLRVTQRTRALLLAHEAVQHSEARFALAAKGAENAIWEWDAETNQLYCSQRWFEMLGLRKRDTTPDEWLSRVHPEDRSQVEAMFQSTEPSFRLEYRIRHAAERWVWVVCRGARALAADGKVLRAAGSQTDITKRKRFELELIRSARFDQLTGLPNRTHLLSHLETLKARSDLPFSFFFFDLDRFKSVNDSLGHLSGDELLVQMAQRIQLAFASQGLVARLGGDEFALVIPDAHNEEEAQRIVEALRGCMRAPFEVRSRLIYSTCSVGVCLSNQCTTVSDFLKNADLAMYRAKQAGPGNAYFFSAQLAQEAALRLELESDLRPGIEADEFELFFQPIVSTRDGMLPRAEVLIRWRHPLRGLLNPGQFLDIVDETGLSGLLTDRVLTKACTTSKLWSDQGRDVELSVNIPPDLFMTPTFAEHLERILVETGANAKLLSLELLESHSIEDVPQLNRQLQKTRRLGVKVYMDDFGTGYSSLSYLTELDIDGFKMDRRFLRDLLNEERAVKAYEAIMHLAQSLQMRVVAEGVERNSEFVILKRAGCEWFQGYLFSKPLNQNEFERFSFHFDSQPASYIA